MPRKPSPACNACGHQPTKRLYTKCDGVQRGVAWMCSKCHHIQLDKETALYI